MSTIKAINVQHPSAATTNIVNDASGNVAVGGTLTVGGVAAVAVAPSTSGNVLTSNGTAWTSAAPSGGTTPSAIGQIPFSTNGTTYTATQKIVQGTAVASTSGTSIDFTGIPSWVKRVTVMFNGVSTNGTTGYAIQLGTSSGIETSGYAYGTSNSDSSTSQFNMTGGSGAAVGIYQGLAVFSLIGSNVWVVSAIVGRSDTSIAFSLGGSKTTSATLDRVRIKTGNGTDTFDAGSINILYE